MTTTTQPVITHDLRLNLIREEDTAIISLRMAKRLIKVFRNAAKPTDISDIKNSLRLAIGDCTTKEELTAVCLDFLEEQMLLNEHLNLDDLKAA